jgi:hypothetical protein
MTVKELKEAIDHLPDDMEVVVADSQWGDDSLVTIEVVTVKERIYLRLF